MLEENSTTDKSIDTGVEKLMIGSVGNTDMILLLHSNVTTELEHEDIDDDDCSLLDPTIQDDFTIGREDSSDNNELEDTTQLDSLLLQLLKLLSQYDSNSSMDEQLDDPLLQELQLPDSEKTSEKEELEEEQSEKTSE